MTGVVDELNVKWEDAVRASRGGHEWRGVAISISSPVRLLAAVREPDERIALLIEGPMSAASLLKIRFEAQGLSLAEHRRPSENIYRLAVTLERTELREIFEVLCADLVDVVVATSTPTEAFSAVSKRLEAWQVCLRTRKGALSLSEQIGLAGELLVLRMIAEVVGHLAAVDAWKGPIDGIHDFVESGAAVEVKSVLGIGSHLHVSRIDQLETSGLSSLTIARVRFRQVREGANISSYVSNIRREIANVSLAASLEFEDKLLRSGYLDADSGLYNLIHFSQDGVCCYVVDERFPRISRANISTAIVDASYTLDEKAILGFRKDDGYLRQMLGMTSGEEHG